MALADRSCRDASDAAIAGDSLQKHMGELPEWRVEGKNLVRAWTFDDHYEAVAFVNAVAWISHAQDHHPDIQLGYNKVAVRYSTHTAGGITEKDLICAAKVSRLSP